MKTLDQERAEFAWKRTNESIRNHGKLSDDFVRIAQGAPSLIMSNGLMQTLAFYKQKEQAKEVLEAVLVWLERKLPVADCREDKRFERVMQKLCASDADTYFRATEEALAILKWLRHFAKAMKSSKEQAA